MRPCTFAGPQDQRLGESPHHASTSALMTAGFLLVDACRRSMYSTVQEKAESISGVWHDLRLAHGWMQV